MEALEEELGLEEGPTKSATNLEIGEMYASAMSFLPAGKDSMRRNLFASFLHPSFAKAAVLF